MYQKTLIILAWFIASYSVLVFSNLPLWGGLLASVSLAMATAAIGFNIQHDGNHQSYSDNRIINRLMAMTLDIVGGSSYLWHWKHNTLHHIYSNIHEHDDDINVGLLGRLAPQQQRLFFHRYQHFYMWLLYGFTAVKWQVLDDFIGISKGRIGKIKIPRPRGWDLAVFIAGKIFFFNLAWIVPSLFHPVWVVTCFYLFTVGIMGLLLGVIFQLAHCVEEADFPNPDPDTNQLQNEWMIHQIETTVDFARNNQLLNWYIGGLNFQIEHHLFPRISHIYYPALSKIVEQTCREYGINYTAHASFMSSLRSHYRFLYRLGQPA